MKKYIIPLIITFILLASSIFLFAITVEAGSITDLAITTSPVDALFHFTVPIGSDTTYIKFDDDVTPLDGYTTYTDPTDIVNGTYGGFGTERWMLVRGLTESTQYSYAIYLNGASDTTGFFNTTARYTNSSGWGDEFFDNYLVDSSSGITWYQSVGTKRPENPLSDSDDISISGSGIVNTSGIWYVWANCYDGLAVPHSGEIAYNTNLSEGLSFHTSWTNVSGGILGYDAAPTYVIWNEQQSRYVAYSFNNSGLFPWRVFNFSVGQETDWAFSEKIALDDPVGSGSDMELHGLSYTNNLSVIQVVVGGLHKDGAEAWRYTCFPGYVIPDGNNYDKWIVLYPHEQHTDIPPVFDPGIVDSSEVPNGDSGYGMHFFERNGMFFGLFSSLEDNTFTGGHMYDYLVYSRNMYDWNIFSSTPIIPNGINGVEFDGGMTSQTANGFYTIGDIDRIYYAGKFGTHGSDTTTRLGRLGAIDFRKEGLTYVKPSGSSGWLRTDSIPRWFAVNFTINGNFTSTAKLNISILDADTDTAYPGFAYTDFDTITTNSTSISPTWGTNTIEDIPDGSFKINFSFDGTGSGELYAYHLDGYGEFSEIQFISINGGTNGTTIYNSTPTFNWTKVSNAIQYNLQIATDSAFTTLVVNFTDINELNYPSQYDENTTRVSFTLPYANKLPAYNRYYCRVRAYES